MNNKKAIEVCSKSAEIYVIANIIIIKEKISRIFFSRTLSENTAIIWPPSINSKGSRLNINMTIFTHIKI